MKGSWLSSLFLGETSCLSFWHSQNTNSLAHCTLHNKGKREEHDSDLSHLEAIVVHGNATFPSYSTHLCEGRQKTKQHFCFFLIYKKIPWSLFIIYYHCCHCARMKECSSSLEIHSFLDYLRDQQTFHIA